MRRTGVVLALIVAMLVASGRASSPCLEELKGNQRVAEEHYEQCVRERRNQSYLWDLFDLFFGPSCEDARITERAEANVIYYYCVLNNP